LVLAVGEINAALAVRVLETLSTWVSDYGATVPECVCNRSAVVNNNIVAAIAVKAATSIPRSVSATVAIALTPDPRASVTFYDTTAGRAEAPFVPSRIIFVPDKSIGVMLVDMWLFGCCSNYPRPRKMPEALSGTVRFPRVDKLALPISAKVR